MSRKAFILLPLLAFVGCDAKIERFNSNGVYALTLAHSRAVGTSQATHDVDQVLHDVFGSPNEPKWPTELAGDIVDPSRLVRCAGKVSSDEQDQHQGLYQEHCVRCHGLDGSGAGPAAALQNPYPRDFRAGVFKWKSTLRSEKPTRDDLLNLLDSGVPGTGMPSFAAVKEEDREALVDYLIYLSVRGEVERRLLSVCVDDIGYDDEEPLIADQRLKADDDWVRDTVREVAEAWASAKPIEVPSPTKPSPEAIARGKDIFHSQIVNCAGCHGAGGNGQAVTLDYDDWAKEYTSRLGITPTDKEDVKPFRTAGALRPRQIKPRKLTDGVFRGGGDPQMLYRRISQGIAGTPMPSVSIEETANNKGLSSNQVWDVIHYVKSLKGSDR